MELFVLLKKYSLDNSVQGKYGKMLYCKDICISAATRQLFAPESVFALLKVSRNHEKLSVEIAQCNPRPTEFKIMRIHQ